MQVLLDTHYLLWFLFNDPRLNKKATEIISDPDNSIYYSTASLWEIDIKHRKHPNIFPYSAKDIADACLDSDIENLAIFNKHIFQLNDLKTKTDDLNYYDPFDLMLLSQAKRSNMKLLTCDNKYKYYDEECIMRV